jgi:signal transduction histidine kinase
MKSDIRNDIEEGASQAPDADRRDVQLSRLSLRYNDMLRSAVDWLWETDARLNLTFVSPPIATTLGIPAQMLIGRNLLHLFGLEKGGHANGRMAAAIAARRSFRDERFVLDASEGMKTSYRVTGVPYYDEAKGRFAGYRGTGTATTDAPEDADEAAEDANQLLEMLESALAHKDQLEWELSKAGDETLQTRLAGIAHELRTPLNAIIGFAEVIKEHQLGENPQRYQDYARDIHESGLHLLEIVNDLIDLAKIDAGYQDLESERLDVEPIVSSAFRMLKDKAREAELDLVNDVTPGTPKVRGERHALRQILLNLLTNAIKYTPTGGAIGAECRVEGTEMLDLTVWDTGVGIAPEDLERVFERSYRVPQQDIERPGSGLGLSIARNLARAMNGDIVIASRTGKGTRVTLRLPLDPEQDTTEDSSDRTG